MQKQTAGLTVLEVWSSGQITRGVIWDSIRGLVTLEHVRRNVRRNMLEESFSCSKTHILAW